MTGARELNSRGLTGLGITVCIVDSGIDDLHPDFAHLRLLAWRDLVNFRPDPYDDTGHGTAMAGLIVADGSFRGVAPRVSLIVVKAINIGGNGSPQNVADGIRFCVDPFGNGQAGADIISLSLGSNSNNFFDITVYDAVVWATSRGVFVVVAAGNAGLANGDVSAAAQVPLAIAVGAVDSRGVRAPFSSIGSSLNRTSPNLKPEIVAPGVQLVSTAPGAHYITVSGTSPATALAAGIIALILEARPALHAGSSANNITILKTALASGATKGPGQLLPHDPWYGYGIINGPATLAAL
jgi:serine protease AprX